MLDEKHVHLKNVACLHIPRFILQFCVTLCTFVTRRKNKDLPNKLAINHDKQIMKNSAFQLLDGMKVK
jgi:hypothetical protein